MIALWGAAVLPLIVGDWTYRAALHDAAAPIGRCDAGAGVRYSPDRQFATRDGAVQGSWRMGPTGLTEQVTRRRAADGRDYRVWPPPTLTTLRWLSPDHVNATGPQGAVTGLIRCKEAE